MKPTYFLGIDAAKHKMRATLSNRSEHVLFEKDLSVQATGLRQLLAAIKRQVNVVRRLLVLILLLFDRRNLLGLFLQGILFEAQEQSQIGDFCLHLRRSSNQFLNVPWREISVR